MSWRDRIDGTGSFRGVKFYVRSDDTDFGRRTLKHEYPKRDKAYTEDMGRKAREYTIACYVLGTDYDVQRDKLMHAIERGGPGTLVHPYFGRMQVEITNARKSESTREGGMASFRLTFVEAGTPAQPTVATDTAHQVHSSADALKTQAAKAFTKHYNPAGLAQDFIDAVKGNIAGVLSRAGGGLSPLANTIAADVRSPADLVGSTQDAITGLRTSAMTPLQALQVYKGLFNAGSASTPVPRTTPSRIQQSNAQAAYHRLVQHTAVAEAARATADASYTSADQALSAGHTVQDALDRQMEVTLPDGTPLDDTTYQALQGLYAAVATDTRSRGAQLPSLTTVTLAKTTPALVMAYSIYADATRDSDIVARNRITNPAFVPGGVPLEIVSDVPA